MTRRMRIAFMAEVMQHVGVVPACRGGPAQQNDRPGAQRSFEPSTGQVAAAASGRPALATPHREHGT